jgi:serine/threonine-protein kinase RsbT
MGALSRRTISVKDFTDATVASSIAREVAEQAGLDRLSAAAVAIVVRELATNIVKHAGGAGEIEVSSTHDGVRVAAVDSGPGMKSPEELLNDRPFPDDGRGSLGQGGSAIRRLMDEASVRNGPHGGLQVTGIKRRRPARGTR